MPGAVVLYSGGQDSTTCLMWAITRWGADNVYPVSFMYGQQHIVEMEQARKICDLLGVMHEIKYLSIEALSELGGAALTDPSIEVEATASEDSGNVFAHAHGLPSTFVPGRNMLFLTLAAAYGAKKGIYDLVTGVCQQDAAGYPDCRMQFISDAQNALTSALDEMITIHTPLILLSKAETWALSGQMGILDIIIKHSHTCYHGDRSKINDWGAGCGECPACIERCKGYEQYLVSLV